MGIDAINGSAPQTLLAVRVRDSLADAAAHLVEKRMFGSNTVLMNGNMLCGVSRSGLMVRVGAEGEAEALAKPFAKPCLGAGRRMVGFIIVDFEGIDSNAALSHWLALARHYVTALPQKSDKSSLKPIKSAGTRQGRQPRDANIRKHL